MRILLFAYETIVTRHHSVWNELCILACHQNTLVLSQAPLQLKGESNGHVYIGGSHFQLMLVLFEVELVIVTDHRNTLGQWPCDPVECITSYAEQVTKTWYTDFTLILKLKMSFPMFLNLTVCLWPFENRILVKTQIVISLNIPVLSIFYAAIVLFKSNTTILYFCICESFSFSITLVLLLKLHSGKKETKGR